MIHTGKELADACKNIAENYKTIYVMGCFGSPMTADNKKRYSRNHPYNKRSDRTEAIMLSDSDTFGFDCVGLIKGLLWGWNGRNPSYYGGADYGAHSIPDVDANSMLDMCHDISTDFSHIQPGEALGMKDHIGVYIGNGLAVECTPRWEDGVQITAVHNIGTRKGYEGRTWVRHGQLPWLAYDPIYKPFPSAKEEKEDMVYSKDYFIRDCQNIAGVKIDGIAGNVTISKMPMISKGIDPRSKFVLPVQKRLEIDVLDGIAGNQFDSAVKNFQKENGLDADGIIGNRTWRKLMGV